ncbi:hypothetical protein ACQKQC_06115 [Vibrio fortis]|uniref:hypothetical protein n=1 Tax=Vibrio fortis TaxID=212667 RepID=UPI0040691DCD
MFVSIVNENNLADLKSELDSLNKPYQLGTADDRTIIAVSNLNAQQCVERFGGEHVEIYSYETNLLVDEHVKSTSIPNSGIYRSLKGIFNSSRLVTNSMIGQDYYIDSFSEAVCQCLDAYCLPEIVDLSCTSRLIRGIQYMGHSLQFEIYTTTHGAEMVVTLSDNEKSKENGSEAS